MNTINDLKQAKTYIDNLVISKHPMTGKDINANFLRDETVLLALLQVSRTLSDTIKEEQKRIEQTPPLVSVPTVPAKDLEKMTAERDKLSAELKDAKAENEKLKKALEKAQEQLPNGVKKEKAKAPAIPKQKPRPVRTECSVLCRGYEHVVPIVKGQVTLENILDTINEIFSADGVKVSLNKLTTLMKEKNVLVMGKAGNQMRLIPTKLGEYYGISLAETVDDSGVNKKVPVYNEMGQYFVLSALSEKKERKLPFEYLPDLIKIVPVTTDEISLSEIVSRINDTYQNEPMVQLQFNAVTNYLASRGVLVPNPDAGSPKAPKYIPADGMRSKGIRFYPADARHAPRTVYNILGQRFVLRELAFMSETEDK